MTETLDLTGVRPPEGDVTGGVEQQDQRLADVAKGVGGVVIGKESGTTTTDGKGKKTGDTDAGSGTESSDSVSEPPAGNTQTPPKTDSASEPTQGQRIALLARQNLNAGKTWQERFDSR